MKISKVEHEVIEMSVAEENALWQEWRDHFINKQEVYVCGHLLMDWDTNDGNNLLLLDRNGVAQWLSIQRKYNN
jgi:hypothetical protein